MSESRLLEQLFDLCGQNAEGDVIHSTTSGDTEAVVCQIRYSSDESQRRVVGQTEVVEQTVFVFRSNSLDLPQFRLQPAAQREQSEFIDGACFLVDIQFADSQKFSRQYSLLGYKPEAVKMVFGKPLRDLFEVNPNAKWSSVGVGPLVVFFQYKTVFDESELQRQVAEVADLYRLVRDGMHALERQTQISRHTESSDLVAAAYGSRGILVAGRAKWMRSVAVSVDEMERFLRGECPRSIPNQIKRQCGGDNWGWAASGVVLLVVGLAGVVATATFAQAGNRMLIIPAAIVTVGGAVLAGSVIQHRRRLNRCLTIGLLTTGRVISLKRTPIVMGNYQRYAATIEFLHQGQTHQAILNLYGEVVDVARYLRFTDRMVRVLVDPSVPSSIVCPDLLFIDSERRS